MTESNVPNPSKMSDQGGNQLGRLRRYLPDSIWSRWQTGDAKAGQEHLQKVLSAVLTYLPQYVVKTRLADSSAVAVFGNFTWATLMFADISGFTAMSERLSRAGLEGAEIVTSIINKYFATMLEIIARHGGDLFKFGGDALLVCFSGQDPALRACRASLQMQQAMSGFAETRTDLGTFSLQMKIGLGTGDLFLTSLGASEQLEFAVMGSALGQMAHAEDLANADEVLLDQATRKEVGAAIRVEGRAEGFYRLAEITETKPTISPALPSGETTNVLASALLSQHPALQVAKRLRLVDEQARVAQLCQDLDTLCPYLPPQVLEYIVASPGQIMIEGEHRPVTVMFANFYGINAIIQALGAERAQEITTILNRHFTTMQGIILKYGGIVNKVDTYAVGYRIMAIFGAPVAHEDDPARAVRAALEMQAAMSQFADLSTSAGRFALKQRIGINTGYVFASNLGSMLRQEYSVMGDEVNLAAHLMGVADEEQVLISQSTARDVQGLFDWVQRAPIKVKGKRDPVPNYQVLRVAADQEKQIASPGRFIGRQQELGKAQTLLEKALAGQGTVLDLSGERGIGKSRLVEELGVWAQQKNASVWRGEAFSYGRGIPYLPWLNVLQLAFGFHKGQDPAKRRDKLLNCLDEIGAFEWASIVGEVLGLEIPETLLASSLDPQLRQERFFDVVLQVIQAQAARSSLLLVLDDMQWADAVSLDLAAFVARNISDSPLLFVLAHRSDMQNVPWREQKDVQQVKELGCQMLHLAEMNAQESLDMACATLGQGDLSPPLRKLILERAQGNPFFVEQVVYTLRESGAIQLKGQPDAPVWVITQADADVELPTTLTGMVMSRLDRLETTNRRLLQVAAVIGVDFDTSVLARVYPYGGLGEALDKRLDQLAQMDLLRFSPPDRHTFRQTLTQEVACGSLSFARRRGLHVRVGEDIEQNYAGELLEHYGVLARHFDEGRVFDKAFVYLVRAAAKAGAEYANEAALNAYQRAMQIVAEQPELQFDVQEQILDALEAMGDIYLRIGQYAQAIESFERAIECPTCTHLCQGSLLHKVARAYEQQGLYEQALQILRQAQQALLETEQGQNSIEMAHIYNLFGWVRMRRGETKEAIKNCEIGLQIVSQLEATAGTLRVEAELHNTLGTVFADLKGDFARAARSYQRGTDLRQQTGDLPGLASSYNNLARTAWAQGEMEKAGDYLQRSLEISRQIGNNNAIAFGYNNLGAVSFTTGNIEKALEYYQSALALRKRIGSQFGVAQTSSNLGEAYLSLQQFDQAQHYLEQAASICESIHSEVELAEVYRLLAEVELAQDNIDQALSYAEKARCTAATIGSLELQGMTERVLAQGNARLGDWIGAKALFESSIELLSTSGSQVELARSHYEFGSILVRQGGQEKLAQHHLQQAIDLFTAVGAEKEAKQAIELLTQFEK